LVGVVTPNTYGGPEPYRILHHRTAPSNLPVANGYGQFDAPRFLVRDIRDKRLHRALQSLQPDLIVVACFPWRIPAALAAIASIAALNIHPSLLPRHRGPDPLFWTFRAGDTCSGVTLHHLSNRFDAGPIIAQAAAPIAPDESLAALEQRLAWLGADLLGQVISGLPVRPDHQPQNDDSVLSEPAPNPADFVIDAHWTIDHARRFIAGVARSHGPLSYQYEGRSIPILGLANGASGVEISLVDGPLRIESGSAGDGASKASF
jgi:methionyl-tRNA formyltransferase